MKHIFLDHAAATPCDPGVLAAMQPYYTDKFYNPSAIYSAARDARDELEDARAQVAQIIGARPGEIIFTAGGTEANNLAIKGVLGQHPDTKVLVGAIEHEAVLKPAENYNHGIIPVNEAGLIDASQLEDLITDDTVLISLHYANNEVGTIQPIRKVAQVAETIRRRRQKTGNKLPLYVHTDACQAGNYLDLHVSRLGVDLMTLNGGKIYGPKQSGVLYVAGHVRLTPQIEGGGQERGLRSGTENIANSIGLAAALKLAQGQRHEAAETMNKLQSYFIESLQKEIPTVSLNGSRKLRLPNNVHVTIPGTDNERMIFELDEKSISAAAGSACNASSGEPSHVLKAMGIGDADARASMRFTMGKSTTKADLDRVVQALKLLSK